MVISDCARFWRLGPLHLNLLGLVVDVNRVHLVITADDTSLLGGLLCGLAGQ